jgi:hypothetical protein
MIFHTPSSTPPVFRGCEKPHQIEGTRRGPSLGSGSSSKCSYCASTPTEIPCDNTISNSISDCAIQKGALTFLLRTLRGAPLQYE